MRHRKPALAFAQFALLRNVLTPDRGYEINPAQAIRTFEDALLFGGWSKSQARIDATMRNKNKTYQNSITDRRRL